jgi:glutathione-specific gamma-glutamylcyclotransferase
MGRRPDKLAAIARPDFALRKAGEIILFDCEPFCHHPELRDKIKPAAESFFRDLDLAVIDAHAAKAGFAADWRTPSKDREAGRRDWLRGRWEQDLWVFGYGSLMWDPSVEFAEVRHAHCHGHERSFCLWDEAGRGSVEAPGLMLAIDEGGQCEGLAFRIESDKLEHETFVLFRREMIAAAYRPKWLRLDTAAGPVEALGFVANRGHERIRPGIALAEQAGMIARAQGMLGSNRDYLSDTHEQLQLLCIDDVYVSKLYAAVCALGDRAA